MIPPHAPAVGKGLWGRNVLQSVVIDSVTYVFAQDQFA